MTDGNGKEKKEKKKEKEEKEKPKKVGWENKSKNLKCVIVLQPDFQGVMFALDNVPLRKIGLEVQKVILQGQPIKTIMNVSHPQAPPYRIILTNDKLELYVKGMPPILIQ